MTTTEKKTGKYYTGVGSRKAPPDAIDLMKRIAFKLAGLGYHLRSGGADGADTAFEDGVFEHCSLWADLSKYQSIYIPWKGFKGRDNKVDKLPNNLMKKAEELAASVHPAWGNCTSAARALHARNAYQVLGDRLDEPSKFLICWAPPTNWGVKGGTNTAWQIAKLYNVPRFNLAVPEDRARVERWLGV